MRNARVKEQLTCKRINSSVASTMACTTGVSTKCDRSIDARAIKMHGAQLVRQKITSSWIRRLSHVLPGQPQILCDAWCTIIVEDAKLVSGQIVTSIGSLSQIHDAFRPRRQKHCILKRAIAIAF